MTENTSTQSHGRSVCNCDSEIFTEREQQWLDSIMKEKDQTDQNLKQKIHKVPEMLRRIEANKDCFDPLVVSIGPYHHGKPELKFMEECKVKMAKQYANNHAEFLRRMYMKIKYHAAKDARNCYAGGLSLKEYDCDKFNEMMLVDGCFIIQFIYCSVYKPEELNLKSNTAAFVKRDLLLLENQIPFQVLKELMNYRFQEGQWKEMLKLYFHKAHNFEEINADAPAHLLELVRHKFINNSASIPSPGSFRTWSSCGSAKQLKAKGITCRCSESRQFTDVQFKYLWSFEGILKLPAIIIDDSTKTFLLNMIAYETSPDGPDDLGVSSYVRFMDSLIGHEEDVKELRSNGIICSSLRNDQQIAELFHQLATDLVPNPSAYADVRDQVEKHCNNKIKVWLSKCLHNKFTSIAVLGGISAAVSGVSDTYFTSQKQ